MLYAILKLTYHWLFLTMREAQYLCFFFSKYSACLKAKHMREAQELQALCSALREIIDPEESAHFKKMKRLLTE